MMLFSGVSDTCGQGLEVGIFFGIAHYQGDLQRSHLEVLEAHHGNGIFARYNFSNRFAIKGHFYQGTLTGSDENYPDIEGIRARNLSFRTPIRELGVQAELTTLNFGETKKHWQKNKVGYRASTYLFAGIAGFYFNPMAYYQGNWYDLRPLGTEGQGLPGKPSKYSQVQLALPIGFGGKFYLTHWSSVGFEIGFRKTFTDYIDDVSSTYPDLALLAERNPMAAILSYRTPEYNPAAANIDPSGKDRGSTEWKDSYIFAGVTAVIRLSN